MASETTPPAGTPSCLITTHVGVPCGPGCILVARPVVDADAVARFRAKYSEVFDAPMPLDEGGQGYAGHRDAAIAAGLRAVLDGWAGRG